MWQPTVVFLLRNLMDRGALWLQSMGAQRVRQDLATKWQQQIPVTMDLIRAVMLRFVYGLMSKWDPLEMH